MPLSSKALQSVDSDRSSIFTEAAESASPLSFQTVKRNTQSESGRGNQSGSGLFPDDVLGTPTPTLLDDSHQPQRKGGQVLSSPAFPKDLQLPLCLLELKGLSVRWFFDWGNFQCIRKTYAAFWAEKPAKFIALDQYKPFYITYLKFSSIYGNSSYSGLSFFFWEQEPYMKCPNNITL